MRSYLNAHRLNTGYLNATRLGCGGILDGSAKTAYGGYVKEGLVLQLDCAHKLVERTITYEGETHTIKYMPELCHGYVYNGGGNLNEDGTLAPSLYVGVDWATMTSKDAPIHVDMDNYSIEAWFEKDGSDFDMCFDTEDDKTALYLWHYRVSFDSSDYGIIVQTNDKKVFFTYPSNTDIMVHICAIVTNGVCRLWLNGAELSQTQSFDSTRKSKAHGGDYLLGEIKSSSTYVVRVYNRALSDEEREDNFYIDLMRFIPNYSSSYVYVDTNDNIVASATNTIYTGNAVTLYQVPDGELNCYYILDGGQSQTNNNIKRVATKAFDQTLPTSAQAAFAKCAKLEYIDCLETIDVSHANTLYDMFSSCVKLTLSADLGRWDTSNCVSFKNTFSYCYGKNAVRIVGLENWDTSKADTFDSMFLGCINMETVSIPSIRSAASATSMFGRCSMLTNISGCGKISNSISLADSPLTPESVLLVLNSLDESIDGKEVSFKSSMNYYDNEDIADFIENYEGNWSINGI